ncbi:hypothetical protein D777_02076 [Marinobacter nitratireducens]|uniref:Uncharacterized protein n=1 Tax=Marinobacter nitratireducens TaxID=1137280 RepID=A0A072N3C2_9GAMM|nr:hypothetical protein D777_02076 [Marinobacter nitratireducens]
MSFCMLGIPKAGFAMNFGDTKGCDKFLIIALLGGGFMGFR